MIGVYIEISTKQHKMYIKTPLLFLWIFNQKFCLSIFHVVVKGKTCTVVDAQYKNY